MGNRISVLPSFALLSQKVDRIIVGEVFLNQSISMEKPKKSDWLSTYLDPCTPFWMSLYPE